MLSLKLKLTQVLASKNLVIMWLVLFLGILEGAIAFPISFLSKINVMIGLAIFPFAIFVDGKTRLNYMYLCLFAVLIFIAIRFNVRSILFIGLALFIVITIEAFLGKINELILFLVIFMSPFFEQITMVLGFPIRLFLSEMAGRLLKIFGLNIEVEGNLISIDGSGFTVDEACMGLNMLCVSLILAVAIITFQYHRQKTKITLLGLLVYFTLVFALCAISNFLRIVFLVIFKVVPTDPLHELVGLACIILYVIIPSYVLSYWISKIFKAKIYIPSLQNIAKKQHMILLISLGVVVLISSMTMKNSRDNLVEKHAKVYMEKFEIKELDHGITQIYNDDILLYVKPISEFISGEHTPTICWKGSGYDIKLIKQTKIDHSVIYVGELQKGNSKLYTAWWYHNGETNTINQFLWRYQMLAFNKKYCIVNVTSADKAKLYASLPPLLKNNVLKIAYH